MKYSKHTRSLARAGYAFPSELLAPFGAKAPSEDLAIRGRWKAAKIPSLLEDVLLIQLAAKRKARLNEIRDLRNRIAHGTVVSVSHERAMGIANDLRSIAIQVDSRVVQHFFVLQKFV